MNSIMIICLLLAVVSSLKVSFKIPGEEVVTLKSPNELKQKLSFTKATLSFKEIPEFATEILLQVGDKTLAVKDKKLEIKGSDFTESEVQLTVFVSSRSSSESLKYPLGTVKLLQTAQAPQDYEFDKLPEIAHVFQKPRPKDSVLSALLFTAVLGALWIPFVSFLKSEGVNVSNLYVNAKVRGWGQLFLGSLVANVVLLGLYWIKLNLFQFLGLASVFSVCTIVIGRNALKARYDWRNQ